jgi:hypothetical protein
VLAAVALGAVVVLAIGLTTSRALDTPTAVAGPGTPSSPTPTPQPTLASPTTPSIAEVTQWTETLQALDAQRAQAFASLDLTALDKVYVRGSPPWHADRTLLSSYRNQKIRVQGLHIKIDKTTITEQTPTTVTLKTTDHLSAGTAIDQAGTQTQLPPGQPTTRLITLTSTPSARSATPTWRITTITQT